ncbi:hypothetical protein [Rhizobium paknamense]|uniref:Uncharacterized protein n=1 Tax=Rhizobium paknamense TaxID=1206817 RepID=A0ABU0I949_9HYPH|nr:hypothetical protein [Rhizobium paknamense]MDQ0454737.1 hypothetical protein [Rhizobium paknamense]
MTETRQDMTISEVLRDPIIRQVLRADGVSLSAFAHLLEDAARQRRAVLAMAEQQMPQPYMINTAACAAVNL